MNGNGTRRATRGVGLPASLARTHRISSFHVVPLPRSPSHPARVHDPCRDDGSGDDEDDEGLGELGEREVKGGRRDQSVGDGCEDEDGDDDEGCLQCQRVSYTAAVLYCTGLHQLRPPPSRSTCPVALPLCGVPPPIGGPPTLPSPLAVARLRCGCEIGSWAAGQLRRRGGQRGSHSIEREKEEGQGNLQHSPSLHSRPPLRRRLRWVGCRWAATLWVERREAKRCSRWEGEEDDGGGVVCSTAL